MVSKHVKKQTITKEVKDSPMAIEDLFPVEEYNGQELEEGKIYTSNGKGYQLFDSRIASGVFEVKGFKPKVKQGLYGAITKVKIPPVPFDVINRVHSFFMEIYNMYLSEVGILLWYNETSNHWEIEVPQQTVTGAHVNYLRSPTYAKDMREDGYFEAGTIHSHAGMAAFHSGTDDNDELTFDGLHMTMGNFNKPNQGFEQRLIINGNVTKLDFYQMVQVDTLLTKFYWVETPKDWLDLVTKEVVQTSFKQLSKVPNTSFITNRGEQIKLEMEKGKVNKKLKGLNLTKQEKKAYKSNIVESKVQCPLCLNFSEIGTKACSRCDTPLHWDEDKVASYYNQQVEEVPDYKYDDDGLVEIIDEEQEKNFIRDNTYLL